MKFVNPALSPTAFPLEELEIGLAGITAADIDMADSYLSSKEVNYTGSVVTDVEVDDEDDLKRYNTTLSNIDPELPTRGAFLVNQVFHRLLLPRSYRCLIKADTEPCSAEDNWASLRSKIVMWNCLVESGKYELHLRKTQSSSDSDSDSDSGESSSGGSSFNSLPEAAVKAIRVAIGRNTNVAGGTAAYREQINKIRSLCPGLSQILQKCLTVLRSNASGKSKDILRALLDSNNKMYVKSLMKDPKQKARSSDGDTEKSASEDDGASDEKKDEEGEGGDDEGEKEEGSEFEEEEDEEEEEEEDEFELDSDDDDDAYVQKTVVEASDVNRRIAMVMSNSEHQGVITKFNKDVKKFTVLFDKPAPAGKKEEETFSCKIYTVPNKVRFLGNVVERTRGGSKASDLQKKKEKLNDILTLRDPQSTTSTVDESFLSILLDRDFNSLHVNITKTFASLSDSELFDYVLSYEIVTKHLPKSTLDSFLSETFDFSCLSPRDKVASLQMLCEDLLWHDSAILEEIKSKENRELRSAPFAFDSYGRGYFFFPHLQPLSAVRLYRSIGSWLAEGGTKKVMKVRKSDINSSKPGDPPPTSIVPSIPYEFDRSAAWEVVAEDGEDLESLLKCKDIFYLKDTAYLKSKLEALRENVASEVQRVSGAIARERKKEYMRALPRRTSSRNKPVYDEENVH